MAIHVFPDRRIVVSFLIAGSCTLLYLGAVNPPVPEHEVHAASPVADVVEAGLRLTSNSTADIVFEQERPVGIAALNWQVGQFSSGLTISTTT